MDFFNKRKVAELEQKISSLTSEFNQYKIKKEEEINKLTVELNQRRLTKEETSYINLKFEVNKLEDLKKSRQAEVSDLEKLIKSKKDKLDFLEDTAFFQEFGIYKPLYNFESSEIFKLKLADIRSQQKEMIKSKTATNHTLNYTVDNSKTKGKEFINDTIKLSLRAFNNESDNIINKVKFNNVDASIKKISTIFEQINKLTDMQHVSIRYEYLELKIKECKLKYEYELKKESEKQEQMAIKERMREEARVLKEIENARKKVEKEETHFENAINDIQSKIATTTSELAKEKLEKNLAELEIKLAEVTEIKNDIENREKNTRAGYVYVISNIGSFGENIYKIGMTRRLEPMDRIHELGSASVPFSFDVHAMIFSEDAPALEKELHRSFARYSVNKVNKRKEFFNITLNMIEEEVRKNHNETVVFTQIAEAKEYRESAILWKDTYKELEQELAIAN